MINYRLVWIIFKNMRRDFVYFVRFIRIWMKTVASRRKNETVGQRFNETVSKFPNKVCFYFGHEQWTFAEVHRLANKIGNYFSSRGYRNGDCIGIFMQNGPEYVAIWLGLSKIGVKGALVDHLEMAEFVKRTFQISNVKAVIYDEALTKVIQEVITLGGLAKVPIFSFSRDVDLSVTIKSATNLAQMLKNSSSTEPIPLIPPQFDDELFYLYTSVESTVIIIKHSRFLLTGLRCQMSSGILWSDIIYSPHPLSQVTAGLLSVSQVIVNGTGMVLRKTFCASKFWSDCVQFDVTVIGADQNCQLVLAEPRREEEKVHKIRLMFATGLRLGDEWWDKFLRQFDIPNGIDLYGCTKGNPYFIPTSGHIRAVGFIPRLLYSISSLRLILIHLETGDVCRNDDTGLATLCPVGVVGELVQIIVQFQGYTELKGYKRQLVHNVLEKGDAALRSGDLFVMDEDGYLYMQSSTLNQG